MSDTLERLRRIEKRAERPAWNWKQLTTKDVPWLIKQLRAALDSAGGAER